MNGIQGYEIVKKNDTEEHRGVTTCPLKRGVAPIILRAQFFMEKNTKA